MTQDKMRRIITAVVAAATVLLVFLLGFLIYQWITIGVLNDKIKKVEGEIADCQAQQAILEKEAADTVEALRDSVYLQWKVDELNVQQGILEGKN